MKILETAYSKQGRKIELLGFLGKNNTKTVLIIGVFHGDEPQGEFLINKFLNEENIQPKNNLLFIPCLNPDGKALNTRQNSNDVDLNRNFPTKNWKLSSKDDFFGGKRPASEIETKFLIDIIEKYKPNIILTIHAPFEVVNYDGDALKIAQDISKITGYRIQEDIGYPTPGSFGQYCGIERKIPTITLELPENQSNQQLWENNKGIFNYLTNC